MNRRSLLNAAARTRSGFDGCVYSLDSLWMKIAPGTCRRIAFIASRLARQRFSVGRTPAEVVQPQVADQGEVVAPAPVVPELLHLVDALAAGNGRVTVLDPGGEHEPVHGSLRPPPAQRRRAPHGALTRPLRGRRSP